MILSKGMQILETKTWFMDHDKREDDLQTFFIAIVYQVQWSQFTDRRTHLNGKKYVQSCLFRRTPKSFWNKSNFLPVKSTEHKAMNTKTAETCLIKGNPNFLRWASSWYACALRAGGEYWGTRGGRMQSSCVVDR